ncbi:hypothetical protein SCLCIDRAFT_318798 [Scleroderma citrinum Foug A]|uniref:Uncharacterized protein n=1 Tax=Scleroderma citrinum Foug A TaxID=1036808 RepID=A0A0C2ZY54_9AGAM|nr:hypothetical protein SCLCIDRAFT_318798 [Scleroderma citrinum Foug A]
MASWHPAYSAKGEGTSLKWSVDEMPGNRHHSSFPILVNNILTYALRVCVVPSRCSNICGRGYGFLLRDYILTTFGSLIERSAHNMW